VGARRDVRTAVSRVEGATCLPFVEHDTARTNVRESLTCRASRPARSGRIGNGVFGSSGSTLVGVRCATRRPHAGGRVAAPVAAHRRIPAARPPARRGTAPRQRHGVDRGTGQEGAIEGTATASRTLRVNVAWPLGRGLPLAPSDIWHQYLRPGRDATTAEASEAPVGSAWPWHHEAQIHRDMPRTGCHVHARNGPLMPMRARLPQALDCLMSPRSPQASD
jgi:hypothetical protein